MVTNYKKRKRLSAELDDQLRSLNTNITVAEVCVLYSHISQYALRSRIKKLGIEFKKKSQITEERRRALEEFVKPDMTFREIAEHFPYINRNSLMTLLYNHKIPFKRVTEQPKPIKETEFFEHDPYYKF
ncbi:MULTISPECIES: hypothetical protein [unclassified Paraflavitalea]|uniref:hypothetical protein n=1 Tax=unclassified Paraflavitalea TaxID=2798305 RepID=UPI003D34AE58